MSVGVPARSEGVRLPGPAGDSAGLRKNRVCLLLCCTVRPLLDNGLKGGNSLKGLLSVITLVYVCLYVCLSVIKLQATVFDPVS